MVADMPNGRDDSEVEMDEDEDEEEVDADPEPAAAAAEVTSAAAATRSGSAICQRPPRLGDDRTTLLMLLPPLPLADLTACAGADAAAAVPLCRAGCEPSPVAVEEMAEWTVAPPMPVLTATADDGAAANLADSMASVSLLLACERRSERTWEGSISNAIQTPSKQTGSKYLREQYPHLCTNEKLPCACDRAYRLRMQTSSNAMT